MSVQNFGDTLNVWRASPSTLFDASLTLDLGTLTPEAKGATLAINATNLFDRKTVDVCFNEYSCMLASGALSPPLSISVVIGLLTRRDILALMCLTPLAGAVGRLHSRPSGSPAPIGPAPRPCSRSALRPRP